MDITLQHHGIEITILHGPYVVDGKPTPRAVQDYTNIIQIFDELKAYAADKLLKLHNNNWREEDDDGNEAPELDRPAFIARLANPSINLYDELGSAVVYFEDGGLFDGHCIEISLTNGKPTHAGIIG
jgi:hypothetical protein